MRTSGAMLGTILELLGNKLAPGMTPKDLSALAKEELKKLGGEPAFLGFFGYPDIICISVNEEVQHTIPNNRVLKEGDVVNLDFGVKYNGMITDAGRTFGVGKVSDDAQRLLTGTEEALKAAIKKVKNGIKIEAVSGVIEDVLLAHNLGIVRNLVGHGVGHELHEEPEIPNYRLYEQSPRLKTGMTIAIEPITTLGSEEIIQASDGWTLLTADGSWSAQFEHTLLVTDDGAEVLTLPA